MNKTFRKGAVIVAVAMAFPAMAPAETVILPGWASGIAAEGWNVQAGSGQGSVKPHPEAFGWAEGITEEGWHAPRGSELGGAMTHSGSMGWAVTTTGTWSDLPSGRAPLAYATPDAAALLEMVDAGSQFGLDKRIIKIMPDGLYPVLGSDFVLR